MLKNVSVILLGIRFLLGPILLAGAWDGETGWWFSAGLFVGLLTDILDGMAARRFGGGSERLREWDSRVDVFFVLCVLLSALAAHAEVLAELVQPLALVFGLHLLSILVPWLKFRRLPAFHAYSAKLAGLAMFAGAVELFSTAGAGVFFWLAIVAAAVSHLDRLAIGLLLPEWQTDVRGFWAAIEKRTSG
ncbi:MAG: hypothetical protein OEV06_10175 [Anaerolineae bacterium]|nr:hypothetical protein [Anaerolineae bacterium]